MLALSVQPLPHATKTSQCSPLTFWCQPANLSNLEICEVWICFNAWDPYCNTQRRQFMLGGFEVAVFMLDLFMIATCFFLEGLGWFDDRWYSSKGSEDEGQDEHHFTNNPNYSMLILMYCFYSIPTKKDRAAKHGKKPVLYCFPLNGKGSIMCSVDRRHVVTFSHRKAPL